MLLTGEESSQRSSKELLLATKEFARESRWLSWWYFGSTLVIFAGLIALAATPIFWPIRVVASVLAGLVHVRLFILYHDYQHNAILRGSPLASVLMWTYGVLSLNPPSIWKRSHDHHHRNNSKIFGASIGSYPVMTTEAFAAATRWQRFCYAASRHPLTILFGYVTIFQYGMCLRPFLLSPTRHFDALLSLIVHFAILGWLGWVAPDVMVLSFIVPTAIATAMGAYLFYAQHNYPSVKYRERAEWDHVDAALHSSSFIKMSALMYWFTGNISYHHVHHLNHRIPFYRLPEAMAALKELQSPGTTTLRPGDVWKCFQLKLWDPNAEKMVAFPK